MGLWLMYMTVVLYTDWAWMCWVWFKALWCDCTASLVIELFVHCHLHYGAGNCTADSVIEWFVCCCLYHDACWSVLIDLWLYSSCRGNRLWNRWFRCISVDCEFRTVWYSNSWSQQWWYDKSILTLRNQNIKMKFV